MKAIKAKRQRKAHKTISKDNMSHERRIAESNHLGMRAECIDHRRTSSLRRVEQNRIIQT